LNDSQGAFRAAQPASWTPATPGAYWQRRTAPPDIDKIAAELASAETGAVVFTSCTGKQLSQERADSEQGVFTHALLRAFRGDKPATALAAPGALALRQRSGHLVA
jgi:uncharacterized caspase-like protein